MNKIKIADVCFEGPEERILNSIKIKIKESLKFEYDIGDNNLIIKIMEIILNNPYCTKDEIKEIKINNKKIKINENIVNNEIMTSNLKKNNIEIILNEECLHYYKCCIFYKIIEGYPKNYFLDLELEKW